MDKSVRKLRNRNLREIELLIWLLILLFLILTGMHAYNVHKKSFDLHNIFLSDVDGLIVGSPVNFMGVPIGYVTKMKIVSEDEIFVRFIVKDRSIKLPKGTIANVEFSGLGGSKSIELYPPDPQYVQNYGLEANDYIIVAQPKRLRDSLVLLYEMFTKIGDIVNKFSNFGLEMKASNIEGEKYAAEKSVNKFIEFSNDWINNIGINRKGKLK